MCRERMLWGVTFWLIWVDKGTIGGGGGDIISLILTLAFSWEILEQAELVYL